MPSGLRVFFSVAAVVLMSAVAWTLRPNQPKSVSSLWFRFGSKSIVYCGLFTSAGYPRRYSWFFPLVVCVLFIAMVWLVPGP